MSDKIKKGLENATIASAKALARAQTGVDRVLWGKKAMIYSATLNPDGSAQQSATSRQASNIATRNTANRAAAASNSSLQEQGSTGNRIANPIDYGVFPIIDLLISVDLCNVINYLYGQIGGPSPKPRKQDPSPQEEALYYIQDKCLEIQKAIDTFHSFPERLIGRYQSLLYEEATQQLVEQQSNTDTSEQAYEQGAVPGATSSGINAQKFNLFNLITYIQSSVTNFLSTTDAEGRPILTPEDTELINEVPLLQNSLTSFTDYLSAINKYANYQSIPNDDVQRLLQNINRIRAICVTIQSLDFQSPASFLNLLPPSLVRQQIADLQKFIDPAQAIPVIVDITKAIDSFNKQIQRAQSILTTAQLVVRIGVVLLRVFRVVVTILKRLPIPNQYTTTGTTNTSSSYLTKTENTLLRIEEVLAQVRSLLNVYVSFLTYIQVNVRELLNRLNILLTNLRLCENLKDSPAVQALEQANSNLTQLQTRVDAYLTDYRAKVDAQRTFGKYTIRIQEEELADEGIVNKRRRGIALDTNGTTVVASDLTFATDENIIVQEVKIKLISAGLVQGPIPAIDDVLGDVAAFLEDDDLIRAGVSGSDFTIKSMKQDIQRYVDSQAQGRALRRRSKAAMRDAQKQVRTEIDKLKRENIIPTPSETSQIVSDQTTQARQENYEVRVFIGDQLSRIVSVRAASVDQAITLTKQKIDPDNKHPTWKYSAKKMR